MLQALHYLLTRNFKQIKKKRKVNYLIIKRKRGTAQAHRKYKRDTPTAMNEQFTQIMAWLIQITRLNVITTIKLKLLRGRDRFIQSKVIAI